MALGAGCRRLFWFILFVELFVAALAIRMQGFRVIFFDFFLLRKLFLGFLAFGGLRRSFVAFNTFLNIVPVF